MGDLRMQKSLFVCATLLLMSTARAQSVREVSFEPMGPNAVCAEVKDIGVRAFFFHSPSVQLTDDGIVIGVSTSNYLCAQAGERFKFVPSGEMHRQYLIGEFWRDQTLVGQRSDEQGLRLAAHRDNVQFASKDIFTPSDDQIIVAGGTIEKRFDLYLGFIDEQIHNSHASPGHYLLTVAFDHGGARIKKFALAQ
jgi:hypothetical protein